MMKKTVMVLMIAVLNCFPLLSQPGTGNSFSVYSNIAYSKKENSSLLLDIYIPRGKAIAGGIGVAGKDIKPKTSENAQASSTPVLIWLTSPGRNIFPTPVAGLVGNGYAIASVQCKDDLEILADLYLAINYIKENSEKFNLDTKNVGIIQNVENGYLAVVWSEGMEKLKSLPDATIKINITATSDTDFIKLQASENISLITGFMT